MRRRTALLLLSLGSVVFLAFGCRKQPTNSNTNTVRANTNAVAVNRTPANVAPTNIPVATNTVQPQLSPQEEELKRLASSFAERYGSYSNQTNFANLENLIFFMTASLKRSTEDFIKAERAKARDTSVYYGLTTRATGVTTQAFDEQGGTASFLVQTHRRESIGTTDNVRNFQSVLLVDMRREAGAWLVDRATWQSL